MMTRRLTRPPRSALALAVVLLISAIGCEGLKRLPDQLFDRRTPRERYEESLAAAGLNGTALARDWLVAASRAFAEAPLVTTPHIEQGFLPSAEPMAFAFRIAGRRGQAIALEMDMPDDSTALVFLEVWQATEGAMDGWRRLAAADSGARAVRYEPRNDGEFLLRAQPELLRGGRYVVTVRAEPTLAFPIPRGRSSDIGSGFGAPRDGGIRDHHGIDIFAPRGTAALAAAEARVTRVETTARGGNVVWLRDGRGNNLYYAHLDRQNVGEGMRVGAGDTVGFVGNTGNARTTPPHLHFGVYRRGEGPLDPRWFVLRPDAAIPRLTADTGRLGQLVRTVTGRLPLRSAPSRAAAGNDTLPGQTVVRVVAAVGVWFRVRLPDGRTGYLPGAEVESTDRALRGILLETGRPLLSRPRAVPAPSDIVTQLAAGDLLAMLGQFGDYVLVRSAEGVPGWIMSLEGRPLRGPT